MATGLADLATVIAGVTGIQKVITDGDIRDQMFRDRGVHNMPYVELAQEIDYTGHSSTARREEVDVVGRITLDKYKTDLVALRAAFIETFKDQDLYHLTIGEASDFGTRFIQVDINVSFFLTVCKT